MKNLLLSLLAIGLFSYLGLGLLLYFGQQAMIFQPSRADGAYAATPADIGLAFEPVRLHRGNAVELHGWFVPARQERGVVLFLHGNAGNLSHRLDSIAIFHQLDYSVFIIDYRGYGLSGGQIDSEEELYGDIDSAWQYLIEQRGYRPQQVVLFGRSLGGPLAAWLAQRHAAGGLILESTLSSLQAFAAEQYPFYPVRWMLRYQLPTDRYLAKVSSPVLLIHSPEDRLIPYPHGRRLFDLARPPKQWLELRGDHNEGFRQTGANYVEGLRRFLQSLPTGTP